MKARARLVAAATLIGLAGTVTAHAAASIGTSPATAYTFSIEGLGLAGDANVTLPDLVVTIGNNLTYQDDVLLVLSGVTPVAPTPTPTLVTCQTTPTAIGYVTTITGGWAFRVTSVSGVSIGELCVFKGLKVTASSLAASPGKLIYRALRFQTGQLVDSAFNPAAGDRPAISIRSQFAIAPVQKLNGIVDVRDERKSFADPETVAPGDVGNPRLNDTLNFTTSVDADGLVFAPPTVSPFLTRVEIIGDWAWVESGDSNSTCDVAEFGGVLNGYVGWTVNETSSCQKLVLDQVYPLGAYTTSVSGHVEVPGSVRLDPTNWLGTAQWNYYLSDNSSLIGTTKVDWDPGAWGINGAQVYIQYLPYGSNLSRVVYVANSGAESASVSGTVYYSGHTRECHLGTAAPRAVTQFAGAVDACVAGAGVTNGQVAVRLTVTAPERDIEVYSAYNVGGNDRGTVVNTSNGRTFRYGTDWPFVPPP